MIHRQMLKYPGMSAPVVSRTASWGIFTSPDSMASVSPKSLTTQGKMRLVSDPMRPR
jgi:hypothetical protein